MLCLHPPPPRVQTPQCRADDPTAFVAWGGGGGSTPEVPCPQACPGIHVLDLVLDCPLGTVGSIPPAARRQHGGYRPLHRPVGRPVPEPGRRPIVRIPPGPTSPSLIDSSHRPPLFPPSCLHPSPRFVSRFPIRQSVVSAEGKNQTV